jgi:hypothetical protein
MFLKIGKFRNSPPKNMLISFNPSERLMPDGILTIDIEIKILPSVMTVVHGSPQEGGGAQRDCVLCHRTSKKNTGTDFFGDMVDNFVDMKLGSILIIFQDGEQKCHAFPLAARNAFGGNFHSFYICFLKAKRESSSRLVRYRYLSVPNKGSFRSYKGTKKPLYSRFSALGFLFAHCLDLCSVADQDSEFGNFWPLGPSLFHVNTVKSQLMFLIN